VSAIQHDVFRFVAIRPPVTGEGEQPPDVLKDERPLAGTFVGKTIRCQSGFVHSFEKRHEMVGGAV
jgi:hypothetical protein